MALHLEPCDTSDAASVSDIWLKAFTDEFFLDLFPRVPSTMQWSINMNTLEMSDPRARFLKIISPSTPSTLDPTWGIKPNTIAFCKWMVPINGITKIDDHWNPDVSWPPESPAADCKDYFETLIKKRKEIMGERPHYFLEVIGTRPEFQRKGAASMLIKWGLELADRDGLEAYIEASDKGFELYRRFGWEEVDRLTVPCGPGESQVDTTVFMIRKPRPVVKTTENALNPG